jgi:two-component system chemotaxis response regulator CheY
MDITMPAQNDISDGIEALLEIKKIDPNANVIMLTSHGENKLVMKAISKGAKGYILKPITKEKIKTSFKKII